MFCALKVIQDAQNQNSIKDMSASVLENTWVPASASVYALNLERLFEKQTVLEGRTEAQ